MSKRRLDERGAVTVFVVIFTVALLLGAGLVIDGGSILNSRREAINEAEAAARAGAQAVVDPRTGELDARAATRLAEQYMSRTGHSGSASVDGDTINVEVGFERPMMILGIGGLHSASIKGHGQARGARGVAQEGDL